MHHNIVVLGDGAVGKTALTRQFCLNNFPEAYDPTIIDTYVKKVLIDGDECELEVFDTAGQEEFIGMRDQYFREGDAFLLVYSVTSRASFQYIKEFRAQLLRIREASSVPIVIVANKFDLYNEREVSTQEGAELARVLKCEFVETSAKTRYNVESAFYIAVRALRKRPVVVKQTKKDCIIM
ncbi:putative small G-protein Ras2 [Rhizoclosmatium globosum]|uniref:small monomeric GTPase n=1 Tax=Rhizoclosmatium globosum TaxID=329046 RepID=A0A1Y2BKD1_9FUNG|nr:Ras GTPase ras2 [Rhizoclosmatium sp. JEL0117]ORY35223.1 putative small G-protein Ras2 [Rhizoclosmatium globosum]|eukprot:ORY35223.1 putative small G-protein Ras2 [Rhizoclosmatium globosum]